MAGLLMPVIIWNVPYTICLIVEFGLACGNVSTYFWSTALWTPVQCFYDYENDAIWCYDYDKVEKFLYIFRIIADLTNVGL